jgi:hypothetical protein|tara:strand:+ start:445 stop:756 length:312 start_codon:yes stop_codon:yes gene_type:complete
MANTFKNYVSSSAVGTSETTIYTVPSSTTAVIIGCNIANVTSSQIRVTVKVADTHVVKEVPVPANSAISVLDGKIIAETTDTVKVTSNTAASADVIVSALEQT